MNAASYDVPALRRPRRSVELLEHGQPAATPAHGSPELELSMRSHGEGAAARVVCTSKNRTERARLIRRPAWCRASEPQFGFAVVAESEARSTRVAQRKSDRVLSGRLLVRVQPRVPFAGVAQQQSACFVNRWPGVQLPPPAPLQGSQVGKARRCYRRHAQVRALPLQPIRRSFNGRTPDSKSGNASSTLARRACPRRLVAQDAAFSARAREFDSRRGC